jgi:hypothetical protein
LVVLSEYGETDRTSSLMSGSKGEPTGVDDLAAGHESSVSITSVCARTWTWTAREA